MLFSSLIFMFLFLPIVLLVYYGLLKNRSLKAKNRFLLLASLFFYGWGEPVYVFLMMFCILYNYGFGLWADKARRDENKKTGRIVITLMLICNLGVLGIFKYTDFMIDNINVLFGTNIPLREIILPIGISFFIFQGISYVVDVYRGNGDVQKNPLDVGLYISFFPQLIAGPIVRYNTIAKEIKSRKENLDDFAEGLSVFIVGLGKKVIIANNIAIVADKAFAIAPDELSVAMAWMGAVAYTLQIYFDFGGYSDMAIGLGRMFGFHFLANFNFPYISRSVSEFWRRWHISLGSWFRDYVYFPLGGSRVNSKARLVFNLFVVWFLTGMWHGANWTFICWGLFYFFWLVLEKTTGYGKKIEKIPFISTVYVMFLVIIGWVMFRADTMTQAVQYMGAMFNCYGTDFMDETALFYLHDYICFFVLGIVCSLPVRNLFLNFAARKKFLSAENPSGMWQIGTMVCLLAVMVTAVAFLAKGSYNPFIYFNF